VEDDGPAGNERTGFTAGFLYPLLRR